MNILVHTPSCSCAMISLGTTRTFWQEARGPDQIPQAEALGPRKEGLGVPRGRKRMPDGQEMFSSPGKQVLMLTPGFSRSEIAPPYLSAVTVVLAEKGARGGEVDSVCVCVCVCDGQSDRYQAGRGTQGGEAWTG